MNGYHLFDKFTHTINIQVIWTICIFLVKVYLYYLLYREWHRDKQLKWISEIQLLGKLLQGCILSCTLINSRVGGVKNRSY